MFGIYPYRLVPYRGLQNPIAISNVIDAGYEFGVARRYNGNWKEVLIELFPGSGIFVFRDPDYVLASVYEEIAGFSMTLMCQYTYLSDLCYEQKKTARADWDGKTHSPFKYLRSVDVAEDHFIVVYSATSLHGQPIEYKKIFNDKNAFVANTKFLQDEVTDTVLKNFNKRTQYPMKNGQLNLIHVPTMLNYWHVELELLPASLLKKDKIRNVKYKADRKPEVYNDKDLMVRFIWKTYLSQNFSVMENPYEDFPVKYSIDTETTDNTRKLNKQLAKFMFSFTPGIVK